MRKLLLDRKGRKQLVETGKDLHTHGGVIKQDQLEAINYSGEVETHKGQKFIIAEPSIIDVIEKMEKRAQIIYPKDAAMIITFTGIGSGSKVVEAGLGVGGLTTLLTNAVRPKGKVTSYEIRQEHIDAATKNLMEAGMEKYVKIKNKSIYDGIDEKEVDLISLDLPEPWMVIEHASKALKMGGYLVSYSPSIEQVKRFVVSLTPHFQDTKVLEVMLREWEASSQRCRPCTRMIGHTGFLVFTRKLQP
jgi:tRNA (adenine57-N1/adenine58-N1)-methyltransferase catalytic subunit